MMRFIKSLFQQLRHPSIRQIGIYTGTNFLAKGASFLLLFIFTNPYYITPSENGLLSLFSTSILFLMPFVSMGIIHSTGADFFKLPKEQFRDLFTTGFAMSMMVSLIATMALYFFRHTLIDRYGFPEPFIWLIPFITFLTFCHEQFFGLVRNNQKPGIYFRANLLKIMLELGLSVLLVVVFALRWQGRLSGIIFAYAVISFCGFVYMYKQGYLFGKVRKSFIRNELIYALPIMLMQISIFCMGSSDKFFLSAHTTDNNETVGIYSIATTFGSIIIVLSSALLQYVFPRIYQQLSAPEADYQLIKKLFRLYIGVMIMGTLLVIIFMPLAYHYFINEKYHSALQYAFLLCIGYFVWTIAYFFYSFLLYYKEKKKILTLSVICIACSLLFNYFFISSFGAIGAAVANLCSYMVVLLCALGLSGKYWRNFFITHKLKMHA